MTASEAKELMQGSTSHKGKWFKTRLAWFSGRINKKIENAAEAGKDHTTFSVKWEITARKYFPLLAQLYEDLGYYVAFSYNKQTFKIYWNLSRLSRWDLIDLKTDWHYDHHIKVEDKEDIKKKKKHTMVKGGNK